MQRLFYLLIVILLTAFDAVAQDSKIINKELLVLSDSVINKLKKFDTTSKNYLSNINLFRITYLSDGLKVVGFVATPKANGKYPCIISCRGGRWNYDLWDPFWVAADLGRMASWGYVVIATQYRGSDGGEGREEYGGKDINDVLNLVPALTQLPGADTSRIGIEGFSRGGMMTYLALKKTCRFKAAAVTAGLADAFDMIQKRPELEDRVYRDLIPNYATNKETVLKERSAIFWADQMCKTTPMLIMHGSSDWRLSPLQSIKLVEQLYQYKHPIRFILYEGADHSIQQYRNAKLSEIKRHFDHYVRDRKGWPSMEPHGR